MTTLTKRLNSENETLTSGSPKSKGNFNENKSKNDVNFKSIEKNNSKNKNMNVNDILSKEKYYSNLVIYDDESIDKKELNDIPFTKALRIDKRSILQTFLYVIANKIEIVNIFYYKSQYVHLSMSLSLYILEFLLDVSLNCFLYTDDVVSEKYHNEGSLETFTSLSLSFASNIISSIIVYFLEKLGEYTDLFEMVIKDIAIKKYYYINVLKFKKYLKIRLSFYYIIQFIMCIMMTYYITIFCIIYSKSQVSIMINYIYGVLESLAISFGITILITILRYISIKYRYVQIYRTSQYLYNKF